MGTFLITFREGIEISLILAIIFGYLAQTGRRHHISAVWRGVAVSTAACIAAAIAVFSMFGELHGNAEILSEAIVMFAAAGVLTWMIVWMRANARSMKGELTSALATATTALSVSIFAAMAVAREGFESVMFLLSAGVQTHALVGVLASAAAGFGLAAFIGWRIYARGLRLNLQRFFTVTGVALILFAASSFAYGVHELREYLHIEGVLATTMWDVNTAWLAKDSVVGGILGMFGWMPHPELARVGAFLMYAAPMLVWFLRSAAAPVRSAQPRTAPAVEQQAREDEAPLTVRDVLAAPSLHGSTATSEHRTPAGISTMSVFEARYGGGSFLRR